MLEPKKVKYRRVHRGNRRGMAMRVNHVAFGSYGLKAVEPGWVTARQKEASRIVISRVVRKIGKMWIRIFPDKPIVDWVDYYGQFFDLVDKETFPSLFNNDLVFRDYCFLHGEEMVSGLN